MSRTRMGYKKEIRVERTGEVGVEKKTFSGLSQSGDRANTNRGRMIG